VNCFQKPEVGITRLVETKETTNKTPVTITVVVAMVTIVVEVLVVVVMTKTQVMMRGVMTVIIKDTEIREITIKVVIVMMVIVMMVAMVGMIEVVVKNIPKTSTIMMQEIR
jgi:uncharacterized membrane protein